MAGLCAPLRARIRVHARRASAIGATAESDRVKTRDLNRGGSSAARAQCQTPGAPRTEHGPLTRPIGAPDAVTEAGACAKEGGERNQQTVAQAVGVNRGKRADSNGDRRHVEHGARRIGKEVKEGAHSWLPVDLYALHNFRIRDSRVGGEAARGLKLVDSQRPGTAICLKFPLNFNAFRQTVFIGLRPIEMHATAAMPVQRRNCATLLLGMSSWT